MITVEIDGKKIEVDEGTMIIEAADKIGIYIPRFCFHKKLSIAANCRMCLVEVEKTAKPLPACATPVTDGMKVYTGSEKVKESQRAVMEFLLINHPLDCPICDQGGECELQDMSLEYGAARGRFGEDKRSVAEHSLGPLIATEMTRCIHCTRCVRFGAEIAGVRELGAMYRGNEMEIRAAVHHTVDSELSGNMIDLCPVGALTSKPYRFQARAFELEQKASISPHDCLGSNIFLHVRRNKVMRVVPKENELINENWLSDRDRFSYLGLYHSDRMSRPLLKKEGVWHEVEWPEALEATVACLKQASQEPNRVGALALPTATTEELFLWQKLMRGLRIRNIDHRLRQLDFRHQEEMPLYPSLGVSLSELEQQDVIVLVGANIDKEQPLLSVRLRRLQQKGGKVVVINPVDWALHVELAAKNIVAGGDLVYGLLQLVKGLASIKDQNTTTEWLSGSSIEADSVMATLLLKSKNILVLLGQFAVTHPQFSRILALTEIIKKWTSAQVGILTDGPNSSGAWLSGCVPHRLAGGAALDTPGLDAKMMWEQKLSTYILLGVEPDLDCAQQLVAIQALKEASSVIALSAYRHPLLLDCADIILPIAAFSETMGTFVNIEGKWQTFAPATLPFGESKPAWKLLVELAHLLQIPEFDFSDTNQVQQALQHMIATSNIPTRLSDWYQAISIDRVCQTDQVVRIAPVPLYATDALVRRATALQQTKEMQPAAVHVNSQVATQFQLAANQLVEIISQEGSIRLPLVIDETVPDHSAVIIQSIETLPLGSPYNTLRFVVV